MTLVEFLAPLAKNKHQDRVLAVLYYRERYDHQTGLTVDDIRQSLKTARVSKWAKVNVADVLTKSGALVDTAGVQSKGRTWNLTDSGRQRVRTLLGLPQADVEVEHDAGVLERLVAALPSEVCKNYLEEALKCLKVGALRACIVFVWTAAVRMIQIEMLQFGATAVTGAVQKHDPKARPIKSIDDIAYVKESILLLAAKDLGLLDKGQKDTLTEALNLRNRCGHPGNYRPGLRKVSAAIEDVTSIVFS